MTTNWASQNPEMGYHIQAKKMLSEYQEIGKPYKASKYFVEVLEFDGKEIERELKGVLNITLYIKGEMSRQKIQERFESVLPLLKNCKRI